MVFPALFVSHGAPTAALEDDPYTRALGGWARRSPRPRAAVVLSAHAEAPGPVRIAAGAGPELVYDFFGFPPPLYSLRYPAPGAPDLARAVASLLAEAGVETVLDAGRGWDHGVWVPMRLLYPAADVPILAISLPVPRTPASILATGRALAPLREQGVLLLGSGGLVHNLRRLDWDAEAAEPWASAFEGWVDERLEPLDVEGLAAYASTAPHAGLAVPTTEHLDPLFFVLGARLAQDAVGSVYRGFRYGTLSLRTLALSTP